MENFKKPDVLLPFPFQRYVNPMWYFNLIPNVDGLVATAHYLGMNTAAAKYIQEDDRYTTREAKDRDAGYQAWHRGTMPEAAAIELRKQVDKIHENLVDNYIFLRKNYKRKWCYFILLRRLLALNNPLRELSAFAKTAKVEMVSRWFPHAEHPEYHAFQSGMLAEAPFVSVIIPTLNRYSYLKDVLQDLEKQTYSNFEVILVDQTDIAEKEFYKAFRLKTQVIFQSGKGQWLARNEAVRNAKGDLLLFFDDDSRVGSDWISEHIKGLDFFNADITAGVSISRVGDKVPDGYSFFGWADQFDSGNAMVKRKVFEKIGLFDRQFDRQRMGDGEFGLRAYLAGFKSITHPYAKRLHLKVDAGGLRDMGSWDAFRPKKLFAPRPIPSVLYLFRKYYPRYLVMNVLLAVLIPSLVPYKFKSRKYLTPLSGVVLLLLLPIIFIQVLISWNRASAMLREGSKIEWLG